MQGLYGQGFQAPGLFSAFQRESGCKPFLFMIFRVRAFICQTIRYSLIANQVIKLIDEGALQCLKILFFLHFS